MDGLEMYSGNVYWHIAQYYKYQFQNYKKYKYNTENKWTILVTYDY